MQYLQRPGGGRTGRHFALLRVGSKLRRDKNAEVTEEVERAATYVSAAGPRTSPTLARSNRLKGRDDSASVWMKFFRTSHDVDCT